MSPAEFMVEAIKALAWPLFALVALIVLRKPLADVARAIGQRARKLTIFEVTIELAPLPELKSSWLAGPGDVRQLTSSQVFDSYSETLFEELLKPGRADYAIVDLGTGEEWLMSRLFVFALVLGEVRGLRAFAFVETDGGTRRKFLGVAAPADVRRALGASHPWLEEALVEPLTNGYGPAPTDAPLVSSFSGLGSPLTDPAQEYARLRKFVEHFVARLQRTTDPPPDQLPSYLEVPASPVDPQRYWERTQWIGGALLERTLAGVLWTDVMVDSPDTSRQLVGEALMRRTAPFVALLDAQGRFTGLVDRIALVSQVAKTHADRAVEEKARGEEPQ
jgi:hypothetical protein